ncbi:hypothetical protein ABIF74_011697 [Bradyrhizobium japonicum]
MCNSCVSVVRIFATVSCKPQTFRLRRSYARLRCFVTITLPKKSILLIDGVLGRCG